MAGYVANQAVDTLLVSERTFTNLESSKNVKIVRKILFAKFNAESNFLNEDKN